MFGRNGASPAHRFSGGRAREFVGTGERDGQTFKPLKTRTQDAIHAELTGSNTATAAGIVARSHAPVLVLCRELIAAGLDPDRAMEAFRHGTLALHVRSIGQAAGLEINSHGTAFVALRVRRAAPPVRKSRPGRCRLPLRPAERGGAP